MKFEIPNYKKLYKELELKYAYKSGEIVALENIIKDQDKIIKKLKEDKDDFKLIGDTIYNKNKIRSIDISNGHIKFDGDNWTTEFKHINQLKDWLLNTEDLKE